MVLGVLSVFLCAPLWLNFFNTKDTKECTKERKGKAIVTMVDSKFYIVFHLE